MGRSDDTRIAVVGFGYVGLPVAFAFAERSIGTVAFDNGDRCVPELATGIDRTAEASRYRLVSGGSRTTNEPGDIAAANLYILTVPTPLDTTTILIYRHFG